MQTTTIAIQSPMTAATTLVRLPRAPWMPEALPTDRREESRPDARISCRRPMRRAGTAVSIAIRLAAIREAHASALAEVEE